MKQYQSKLFVMLSFMFMLTIPLQSHARSEDQYSLYPVVQDEKSNSVPASFPAAQDLSACACASSVFSQPSPTPSHAYKVKRLTNHGSETSEVGQQ